MRKGDKIHADMMEYPSAPLFPAADGTRLPDATARLVRWTFDLSGKTNTIQRTPLDDLAGEFPRFDERRAGLGYRHGWFAGNTQRPGVIQFDTLAHFDHQTGRRADYTFDAGDAPGEPIFVQRSADAAEGDGWLLSVVYRRGTDTSDLAIFEAQDVAKGPIALAHMPRRVPFGFHGNWRQG